MQIGPFTRSLARPLVAAVMVSISAGAAVAQSHDHSGIVAAQPRRSTPQENELVQAVRDATAKFKTVTNVAGPGEGYERGDVGFPSQWTTRADGAAVSLLR